MSDNKKVTGNGIGVGTVLFLIFLINLILIIIFFDYYRFIKFRYLFIHQFILF